MSNLLTHNAFKGSRHPETTQSEKVLGIRGMQRMAGYIPAVTYEAIPQIADPDKKQLSSESTIQQFYWPMRSIYRGFLLNELWMNPAKELTW
jgi:hypothetical protein